MDTANLVRILTAFIDGSEQSRARHLAAMLRDELKRMEKEKWEKGFKGFDNDIEKA